MLDGLAISIVVKGGARRYVLTRRLICFAIARPFARLIIANNMYTA